MELKKASGRLIATQRNMSRQNIALFVFGIISATGAYGGGLSVAPGNAADLSELADGPPAPVAPSVI